MNLPASNISQSETGFLSMNMLSIGASEPGLVMLPVTVLRQGEKLVLASGDKIIEGDLLLPEFGGVLLLADGSYFDFAPRPDFSLVRQLLSDGTTLDAANVDGALDVLTSSLGEMAHNFGASDALFKQALDDFSEIFAASISSGESLDEAFSAASFSFWQYMRPVFGPLNAEHVQNALLTGLSSPDAGDILDQALQMLADNGGRTETFEALFGSLIASGMSPNDALEAALQTAQSLAQADTNKTLVENMVANLSSGGSMQELLQKLAPDSDMENFEVSVSDFMKLGMSLEEAFAAASGSRRAAAEALEEAQTLADELAAKLAQGGDISEVLKTSGKNISPDVFESLFNQQLAKGASIEDAMSSAFRGAEEIKTKSAILKNDNVSDLMAALASGNGVTQALKSAGLSGEEQLISDMLVQAIHNGEAFDGALARASEASALEKELAQGATSVNPILDAFSTGKGLSGLLAELGKDYEKSLAQVLKGEGNLALADTSAQQILAATETALSKTNGEGGAAPLLSALTNGEAFNDELTKATSGNEDLQNQLEALLVAGRVDEALAFIHASQKSESTPEPLLVSKLDVDQTSTSSVLEATPEPLSSKSASSDANVDAVSQPLPPETSQITESPNSEAPSLDPGEAVVFEQSVLSSHSESNTPRNEGSDGSTSLSLIGEAISVNGAGAGGASAEKTQTAQVVNPETSTLGTGFSVEQGTEKKSAATIVIKPKNNAPTMQDGVLSVGEDGFARIDLKTLASDVDHTNSELSFQLVAGDTKLASSVSSDGVLTFDARGKFDYLDKDEVLDVPLSLVVKDADGASANSELTVSITGSNDAPKLALDDLDVDKGSGPLKIELYKLGTDVDSDDDGDGISDVVNGPISASYLAGKTLEATINGSAIFEKNRIESVTLPDDFQNGNQVWFEFSDGGFYKGVQVQVDGGVDGIIITQTAAKYARTQVDFDNAGIVVSIGSSDRSRGYGIKKLATSSEILAEKYLKNGVNYDGKIDGEKIEYEITTQADYGKALIRGAELIFTQEGDFDDLNVGASRDARFAVTATDEHGASVETWQTVTVTRKNILPEVPDVAPLLYTIENGKFDEGLSGWAVDDVPTTQPGTTITSLKKSFIVKWETDSHTELKSGAGDPAARFVFSGDINANAQGFGPSLSSANFVGQLDDKISMDFIIKGNLSKSDVTFNLLNLDSGQTTQVGYLQANSGQTLSTSVEFTIAQTANYRLDIDTSSTGNSNGKFGYFIVVHKADITRQHVDEGTIQKLEVNEFLKGVTDADSSGPFTLVSVDASSAKGAALRIDGDFVIYDASALNSIQKDLKVTDTFSFTVEDPHGGRSTAEASVTLRGTKPGGSNDPIVLDIDGDGFELSGSIEFDLDADGHKETIAWARDDDAVLVMDLNSDGQISNGHEVFSEVFGSVDYETSLDALKSLDENQDGVLNADDEAFEALLAWRDADGNGIVGAGELSDMQQLGITSISLEGESLDTQIDGQSVFAIGKFETEQDGDGQWAGVAFKDLEENTSQTNVDYFGTAHDSGAAIG